jgi:hypothetical protein
MKTAAATMIFREGGLNLIWGLQNVGKTSLILRGLAAGGWTRGLILCDDEFARNRYSRATKFPIGDEFTDLETADVSDGGVIVLSRMIYDQEQWAWLIPRLREYKQRHITVVVSVIWMYYLPRPIVEELFDRVFLFRTSMNHNRKRMFEMFGYARWPTRADFDVYMDEMGQGPLWYGAFDMIQKVTGPK